MWTPWCHRQYSWCDGRHDVIDNIVDVDVMMSSTPCWSTLTCRHHWRHQHVTHSRYCPSKVVNSKRCWIAAAVAYAPDNRGYPSHRPQMCVPYLWYCMAVATSKQSENLGPWMKQSFEILNGVLEGRWTFTVAENFDILCQVLYSLYTF
jgi:hypothetical protein